MKDKLLQQTLRISKELYSKRIIVMVLSGALCLAYVIASTSSSATSTGRDEVRYEEGLNSLKKFKFDENAISQLRSLQGTDVTVESDITGNRVNPFSQ